MKKLSIFVLAAAAAMALTACGGNSKKENVETEAAPTQSSLEQTEAETTEAAVSQTLPSVTVALPEEFDPEYFEGIITDMNGSTIAIKAEDGTSMMFDLSSAELPEEPVIRGSEVGVEYAPEAVDSDVYATSYISVLMDPEQLADIEGRDPVIYGKLQTVDINDLYILDDAGIERQFDNQISRTVSFSDIKVGDEVAVTYGGSVLNTEDDEDGEGYSNPYALKIVSMDAIGSEEANANYITGEIDTIYEDGVITVSTELITIDAMVDSSMIEGFEEGDLVRVYYTGSISGLSITADKVEAAE